MIGFGRYNLLLKLGQGGMGAVYLARQKTLRRFCAVKVINPQFAKDEAAAERFLREARSTAALTHPNLVSIFDCDQHEGQYFIAMEYVEGLSLAQIIRDFGALPLPLALHFLKQAAVGIEYVHGKDIIHRDIKPDNMIVDSTGVLKIMDLGLAKERLEGDQSMTVTGTVMGSPHYMSPEQINDSKAVDHRTDLYSLGISFYQMLTGHVPFQHSSAAGVCVAHLNEPVPSVAMDDPEVTQALDALIASMTAKNREERVQSSTDLLTGLDPWIANFPTDATYQELLASMGFEKRRVATLLETSSVDVSSMDADVITTAAPTGPEPSTTPPTIAAREPSMPPAGRVPPYLKWAVAGAAAVLVFLLVAIGISLSTTSSVKEQPIASLPPVASPVHVPAPPATPAVATHAPPVQPKVGGMVVRTKPDNASVMLLTLSKSQPSPATFGEVPVGKHRIKVIKSGYRDRQQEIEVKEGQFVEVTLELDRIPGRVRIESNPAGVEVYVDNRLINKTPCELEGGDGEEMHGELRMEGYAHQFFQATLKEGGDVKMFALQAVPKPPPPGEPGQPFAANQPNTGGGTPPSHSGETGHQTEPSSWKPDGRGQTNNEEDSPRPFNEGQMGMGGMEEGWRKCKETLDMARNAKKEEWNQQRAFMLETIESVMKEQNPNPRDPSIRKAVSDFGKILDKARGMSETQYNSQKQELIRNIMRTMQSGKGMKGPPGGRPQWR